MYRYALKELWRHKARTAANILGYATAVAFMIAVVSLVQSHEMAATRVLKSTGTHFMAFIPESKVCANVEDCGPCAEGVYTTMIDANSLERIKNLPGVRDAAPYLLLKMYHDEYKSFLTIGGIDPAAVATTTNVCASTDILEGRYLDPEDGNDVVVEESYARAANLDANGFISAFGREFKTVGIVNSGIRPAKADMYAPIATVRSILQQYSKVLRGNADMNIVLVEVADARLQEEVMKSVRKSLAGRATISTYACYVPANNVISITERAALAISFIVAVFVILFASKSQLASVVERTRDIGILKSLGWSGSDVMRQILVESIIQSLVGGAIGCGAGIFLIFLLRSMSFWENIVWSICYPAIVASISLVLIGGIVAGILPACRAYKLKPAEAIRRW